MNCSPSGSSIHGIFQARILEGVAISYSRGSSLLRDWTCNSSAALAGRFFTTKPCGKPHAYLIYLIFVKCLPDTSYYAIALNHYIYSTLYMLSCSVVSSSLWPHGLYVAHQAPVSMGFSRQEYWSGLPLPAPGNLPDPGIKPVSPVFLALAGRFFTTIILWGRHGSFTHLTENLSSRKIR